MGPLTKYKVIDIKQNFQGEFEFIHSRYTLQCDTHTIYWYDTESHRNDFPECNIGDFVFGIRIESNNENLRPHYKNSKPIIVRDATTGQLFSEGV